MPIKDTSTVHYWICSSCAGWHYAYCDAQQMRADYESSDQCIDQGRIVKCPINKYHFIVTRSYPAMVTVLRAFPKQFDCYGSILRH